MSPNWNNRQDTVQAHREAIEIYQRMRREPIPANIAMLLRQLGVSRKAIEARKRKVPA